MRLGMVGRQGLEAWTNAKKYFGLADNESRLEAGQVKTGTGAW